MLFVIFLNGFLQLFEAEKVSLTQISGMLYTVQSSDAYCRNSLLKVCVRLQTNSHFVSIYTISSTFPSPVRRYHMITYANASVSRLISVRLTWICHLYFLFTISVSHLIVLYWQYHTPDAFVLL